MAVIHKVDRGECLSSIAYHYGFEPETIWQHPDNASLRELRGNPNVLLEGDEVFIPDKRIKKVTVAAGRCHRFRRRGVPEVFRLRFLDWQGLPRQGLAYTCSIDGIVREGKINEEGELREWIPPGARRADIILFEGDRQEHHRVHLGHLDPVDTVSGVRARLNNLGYSCGPESGEIDEAAAEALRRFQNDQGLEPTGQPDEETLSALERLHGS